ncbi:unnamed protein product [Oncorhynchus mykiss]|uniref:Uncharacterized protein n=1 Tax=Oncorhynchus mykiss TaxID=8022 RepID=A0A060Z3V0_ONCMY|nr:unnamed protein product [Oncorhynchus mykiss]
MDVKVLTMVKTSELFERWRNLQVCKWQQNMVETNNFKMSLSRCCNAPSFLFTTKRNTPAGTKLRYEVDTSGILPISTEVFKMFPDVSVPIITIYSISSCLTTCHPCVLCYVPYLVP